MNFLTVLNIAKTVFSLIPLTVQAIKAVEEAIPGNGKGEQKLAMVRAMIAEIYDITEDLIEPFEEVWKRLSPLISKFVAIFNSNGEFKSK